MELNDVAASIDFLEETKRAIDVSTEMMNSAYYIIDADFRGLEEPHEADVGEEQAESVDFLRYDPPHDVRLQSELENAGRSVFGPIEMEDLCNRTKNFIKPGIHFMTKWCAL